MTPTQFSGGSRVVHYGLMKMRSLVLLLLAASTGRRSAIGMYLAIGRGVLGRCSGSAWPAC